jgi:hypothetical protein
VAVAGECRGCTRLVRSDSERVCALVVSILVGVFAVVIGAAARIKLAQ